MGNCSFSRAKGKRRTVHRECKEEEESLMSHGLFLKNYWLDKKQEKERDTKLRRIVDRVVKKVKVKRIVKNAGN